MKSLSAVDLHYMKKELEILIDGKIDKIFHDDEVFLLVFHVPRIGKKKVKIVFPSLIYLTEQKGSFPEPSKLCMTFRKYLGNARLRSIQQKNFERILEFNFETKDAKFDLIVELFAKGNIILCREDNTIIIAQNYKRWSQRTIRGGIEYAYPDKKHNPLEMNAKQIFDAINDSDKENLVKKLAIELSLGGLYSEELIQLSGLDKKKVKITQKESEKLHKSLQKMLSNKLSAAKYEKEITPIKVETLGKPIKEFKSFSEAIDENTVIKRVDPRDEQRKKVQGIIKSQEKKIKILESDIADNQRKGEILYENYQVIEDILVELKKAQKKYSWKEIKSKLKGHKIIKEINEKDRKVLIEIE